MRGTRRHLPVMAVLALWAGLAAVLWAVPGPAPEAAPEASQTPPANSPPPSASPAAKAKPLLLPPPPVIADVSPPKDVQPQPAKTVTPLVPAAEPPMKAPARKMPTPMKTIAAPKPEPRVIEPLAKTPRRPIPVTPAGPVDQASDIDPKDLKETAEAGRVLLKLLEHGTGPRIEIAWPESPRDRDRLFALLRSCLGMRVAYMDPARGLFVNEGKPGEIWQPNVDRYSGFLRQPSGPATASENDALRRIAAHHGSELGGAPVRLFSRRADALLLGGLRRIIGGGYETAKTIQARYEPGAPGTGGLAVSGIRIDGRAAPGRIDLTPLSPTCLGGF